MLDGKEGKQGFRPHKHDLSALASPYSPMTASNADGKINIKPSKFDLSPMGSGRRFFYNEPKYIDSQKNSFRPEWKLRSQKLNNQKDISYTN